MTKSELARHLETHPKQRASLREALNTLEKDGQIVRLKKGRYAVREESGDLITGKIRFRRDGHAYLLPEKEDPKNARALSKTDGSDRIFIPARHTLTALDGDRVSARLEVRGIPKWWKHVRSKRELLERDEKAGGTRTEARIHKILARGSSDVLGTFRQRGQFTYVEPDDSSGPETIRVTRKKGPPLQDGEKVIVKIERWDSREAPPEGRILKRLGIAGAPGVDILSLIYRHRLPVDFPEEVTTEAAAIPDTIPDEEISRREDWRDRFVFTVDPFDARDFDDAICTTRLEDGGWELAVHIADVSHYVRPGSALDREALNRGNSVYLVDRVLPMLPEALSNGICSLKPDVDRLTRAVVMRFDSRGRISGTRFAATVIRSKARLTYEQAFQILKPHLRTGKTPAQKSPDPLTGHLTTAWELASLLRRTRMENGSLDLDFAEIKVHLDDQGRPTKLERVEYDESHQLIEEFMLTANEAVAKRTRAAASPSIYRIHEEPDPSRLYSFGDLAQVYGIRVGDLSLHGELQKTLTLIRGRPEEHALKLALLKSLKRAVYSPHPTGHFGLAKTHYTHYTSPIRRYADLVVHRVLDRLERGGAASPEQSLKHLEQTATHISDTERAAADAENESRRLKEMEYLDNLARSSHPPQFRAVVYEVRRFGLFVELVDLMVRGAVRREDLPPGDYFFDAANDHLLSRDPKRQFGVGDRFDVCVANVDFERKRVDFRAI